MADTKLDTSRRLLKQEALVQVLGLEEFLGGRLAVMINHDDVLSLHVGPCLHMVGLLARVGDLCTVQIRGAGMLPVECSWGVKGLPEADTFRPEAKKDPRYG